MSSEKSIKLNQADVEHQPVEDRIEVTNKKKRASYETSYLYRDFVMKEGLMMTLDKGFIRTLFPVPLAILPLSR